MKLRTKIAIGFLAVVLAATVCAVMAARRAQGGTLAIVGISRPEDIEAIGFESRSTFRDSYQPMYWITEKNKIARFHAAVVDPDTRIETYYLMAVLGKRGQVVLFDDDSQYDLKRRDYQGSALKIFSVESLLDGKPDRTSIRHVEAARIRYYVPSKEGMRLVSDTDVQSHPGSERIDELARQLVCQFNPRTVGGVLRVDRSDYRCNCNEPCLDIKLAKPISFRALAWPEFTNYLGNAYTDIKLTKNTIGEVLAFRATYAYEDRVFFHIVFRSEHGRMAIVTRDLPRREIKGYDKDGNPIMGKDLFDELVREPVKPAK